MAKGYAKGEGEGKGGVAARALPTTRRVLQRDFQQGRESGAVARAEIGRRAAIRFYNAKTASITAADATERPAIISYWQGYLAGIRGN